MQSAVNPHASPSLSPHGLFRTLWRSRHVLRQLTHREIQARNKGSLLGLLWAVLTPLLMLVVYTFVFSKVLKTHWRSVDESTTEFASVLFVGLCVFNLFADIVNRSPRLVVDHANFVKRVVFPIEMLPVVNSLATLFQFAINVVVLVVSLLLLNGSLPLSALFLPLVIAPVLLLAIGVAWLLASLGVYLRDIAPIVALGTMALMFLSPVFYSVDAIPKEMQFWYMLNPLTVAIDQARTVLFWGGTPRWPDLAWQYLGSIGCAWLGYCWFQLTKKGFSDVL